MAKTFDGQVPATDGGDRTHTHLRELDFESSASANSATSAFVRRKLVTRLPAKARGKEFRSSRLPKQDISRPNSATPEHLELLNS